MNILFIGDIVGKLGRQLTKELLPELKKELAADLVIANGENAAHGVGITLKIYDELMEMGIDVLTMGNHIWDNKEFIKDVDKCPNLVRPANYPPMVPGKDHIIIKGVGIINLVGRIFMQPVDCPFRTAEPLIEKIKKEAKIVIVDMHAEASSEKMAMGFFLDGKVSAVIGTHSHVMTADEQILPNGTAYITDLGMVGAQHSVIGVQIKPILERFLTQMPRKYDPEEKGPGIFNAVFLKIDAETGKALEIKRIFRVESF